MKRALTPKRRQQLLIANKKWRATFKGGYVQHKNHAKSRKIEFLLSLSEWKQIWEDSGKWELRGNRTGKYNMMRKNDSGPYSLSNVYIGTHSANVVERNIMMRKFNKYEKEEKEKIKRLKESSSDDCPF